MTDRTEAYELKAGDVVKVYGDTEKETDFWGTAVLISEATKADVDGCLFPDWAVKWRTVNEDIHGAQVGQLDQLYVSPDHLVEGAKVVTCPTCDGSGYV